MADPFRNRISEIIARRLEVEFPPDTLESAIRQMRERIEQSAKVPSWVLCDFKKGPGGVIDLEFMAQYFQLRHMAAYPELIGMRVDQVFELLVDREGFDRDLAAEVVSDYKFLRRLESGARLLFETESSRAPSRGDKWEAFDRVGRSLLPEGVDDLKHYLLSTLRRIRERFVTPFESIGR